MIFGPCNKCKYFREVVDDVFLRRQKVEHRLYGEITTYALAQRDWKTHDCDEHRAALIRLFQRGVTKRLSRTLLQADSDTKKVAA